MRKILLLLFLVLSSADGEASECGCDPSADLNIRQLIEADVIFKGQMITKRTVYFPDLGYRYVATFRIEELFSGNSMSDTLDIEFGYGEDYCSVYFQPLVSYFIAATKDSEFPYFQTNYCSGNRKWENLSKRDHRLLVDFQNGKSDLEWRDRFHRVYAKGRISQKKPIGFWQYFGFNGYFTESGHYLDGKKEGEWVTFFYPATICFTLDLPFAGKICDLSQVTPPHPAGWVSSVTPYKNGKNHGTVLTFRASGCIESEGNYINGILIGKLNTY